MDVVSSFVNEEILGSMSYTCVFFSSRMDENCSNEYMKCYKCFRNLKNGFTNVGKFGFI